LKTGTGLENAYEKVRAISPMVTEDRPMSADIERVAAAIRAGEFDER
jgi:histidine ammonia-lyase